MPPRVGGFGQSKQTGTSGSHRGGGGGGAREELNPGHPTGHNTQGFLGGQTLNKLNVHDTWVRAGSWVHPGVGHIRGRPGKWPLGMSRSGLTRWWQRRTFRGYRVMNPWVCPDLCTPGGSKSRIANLMFNPRFVTASCAGVPGTGFRVHSPGIYPGPGFITASRASDTLVYSRVYPGPGCTRYRAYIWAPGTPGTPAGTGYVSGSRALRAKI